MTGTFKIDGTKVTVSFAYTAKIALVQDVIDACAENLWVDEIDEDEVVNPFESASNQDKLNVVDVHIKSVLLNMANSFKSNQAQALAREELIKHDLGE